MRYVMIGIYIVFSSSVFCQNGLIKGIYIRAGTFSFPLEAPLTKNKFIATKFGLELGYDFNRYLNVSITHISYKKEFYNSDYNRYSELIGDHINSLDYDEFVQYLGAVYHKTYSLININWGLKVVEINKFDMGFRLGTSRVKAFESYINYIYPSPWIPGGSEVILNSRGVNYWTFNGGLYLNLEVYKNFTTSLSFSIFRNNEEKILQPYFGVLLGYSFS